MDQVGGREARREDTGGDGGSCCGGGDGGQGGGGEVLSEGLYGEGGAGLAASSLSALLAALLA